MANNRLAGRVNYDPANYQFALQLKPKHRQGIIPAVTSVCNTLSFNFPRLGCPSLLVERPSQVVKIRVESDKPRRALKEGLPARVVGQTIQ